MAGQRTTNRTTGARLATVVLATAAGAGLWAAACPGAEPQAAGRAGAAGPEGADPHGTGVTILDGSGVWRVLHSWAPPTVATEKGHFELTRRQRFDFLTAYPPAGWTGIDFDDSRWARQHFFHKYTHGELDGRAGSGSPSPYLRRLSLRGKFTVTDPSQVQDLWLDLGYRGGVVVHLNGREIARRQLPPAALARTRPATTGPSTRPARTLPPGQPADAYPLKAYVNDKGKPWSWHSDRDAITGAGVYELRVRRLRRLPVPRELLVRGTNVLAVQIHAAKYPPEVCESKSGVRWSTCGLVELHLRASGPGGIAANVVRPKGVQVWSCNLLSEVTPNTWGDPHDRVVPIRLAGPRNGCSSGKVVVSSDQPIRGLTARVTEARAVSGTARLPASALQVRYGRLWRAAGAKLRDDALVDDPLKEVPVVAQRIRGVTAEARRADGLPEAITPGATQCVYVTANIPDDAAPGDYRATLELSCADLPGGKPVHVPVELKVIDWRLPDPADFTYWFGLIQSPDGVGLHYRVPMWSAKHFELIGKSLRLIAQTGGPVLFINLMAETEYGNDHSMVLWTPADGKALGKGKIDWAGTRWKHDFSRVEKYVAQAVKHLGKPRFVVLGVWQPCERRTAPRVSVLDPGTGAIRNVAGPPHGSTESRAFWRPVLTGVRDILARSGIRGRSLLLGYASDAVPDLKTARVFWDILPKAGWQAARHAPRGVDRIRCAGGEAVAVRYTSNVWGSGNNYDPDVRRVYGWNFAYTFRSGLRTWLDRTTYDAASFSRFRCVCEQALLADRPGLGQIGADFWPPAAKAGKYRLRTLYSRFPHSANVGSGNRGCTTNQLLYPAPDGAAPTLRYELVRENMQECEARIFLEKQLILKKMCPLSPALKARAQAVLDERTRWHRLNYKFHGRGDAAVSWPCSGWEERAIRLYEAAAAAAKELAKKKRRY